jgi:hypothetical protein
MYKIYINDHKYEFDNPHEAARFAMYWDVEFEIVYPSADQQAAEEWDVKVEQWTR